MIVGFRNTTKFFLLMVVCSWRKALPITGISPSKGTFLIDSWMSSSINPPNTIVWLSSTMTTVSIALLLVTISADPAEIGPESEETSCSISNLIELPSLI